MAVYGVNTALLGLVIVGAFVIWKFILQPIINEGEPIEPKEDSGLDLGLPEQEEGDNQFSMFN